MTGDGASLPGTKFRSCVACGHAYAVPTGHACGTPQAERDAAYARGYAEAERAIVAWLRKQAAEWGGGRDPGAVAFETAANTIERGEHRGGG